jgi:PhnB protein
MIGGMSISKFYARLVVDDAAAAIDFYKSTMGATETERHADGDGRIVQAELLFGDVAVAVKDSGVDPSPATLGGTPVIMAVDTDDLDAMAGAMQAACATVLYPITDHEYGRAGRLADPWGHQWMLRRPSP